MNWPFFRSSAAFREFQVVRLLGQYTAPDGILPLGSIGTVVHKHRADEAYEVEFAEPFATVVTLRSNEVAAIDG